MSDIQNQNGSQTTNPAKSLEGLLWLILVFLLLILAVTLISQNWQTIFRFLSNSNTNSFSQMVVTNGFHRIQFQNGQYWDLSYEANHERQFAGTVSHFSVISEPNFALLTHDILVTSQDFADLQKVRTSVSNHHFTWYSSSGENPKGTINLLHTVPMNGEIRQQLDEIKKGDQVIITGWDIDRIDGFTPQGNPVGYWQDSGCNTTLVIEVEMIN